MSDTTTTYRLSLFPAPKAGDPSGTGAPGAAVPGAAVPSSAVTMEISGNPEYVRKGIQVWRDAVCSYGKPPENAAAEASGFLLHDGFGEDVLLVCPEEDILSSLLAFFCGVCDEFQTTVKEILCRGAVYEDVSTHDLSLDISNVYISSPLIKVQAKKNGCDTEVYFFGPNLISNIEEISNEYSAEHSDEDDGAFASQNWNDGDEYAADADSGDAAEDAADADPDDAADDAADADSGDAVDAIDEAFEEKLWNNIKLDLAPRLSGGVVEAAGHLTYVKTCTYKTQRIYYEPVMNALDAQGNPQERAIESTITTALHIFLETDEQGLTFSVLLDGRLYKKLSHDAEKIVFYDTPLDRALRLSAAFRQGENPKDLIFRKIDGAYRYDRDPDGSAGPGGLTLDPPQAPDPDSLDRACAERLYDDYLKALCTAILNAQAYRTAIGTFRRDAAGDGRYRLETDGFLVTGMKNWKVLRHWNDRVPITYLNFLEDYPGEDMFSSFSVESAAFVEESTGNTVTLFPKDAYTRTEIEKTEFDEDAVDTNGDLIKRCIPVNSALRVLIQDPLGAELFDGEFAQLRKGNVFGGVKLPETIRFSKKIANFTEDFHIYQTIREGILRYGVRKILAVFTRTASMDREEIERLLYANGEQPDRTVTDLAVKMKRRFIRTGEIPNIAMMGQAGTGKSTMIRQLGAVFGKRVRFVSPSDLKAQYIGQTEGRVVKQLAEALKAGEIFFIDEAYELMSDDFGREAVALLLPIMSGDRSFVAADRTIGNVKTEISIDFEKREITEGKETTTYREPGYPAIWIAGYEDDIRLMLGRNKGFYRRLQRIVLRTPTPEQLYETLLTRLKKMEETIDAQCYETLTRQFGLNQEMLLKFFNWGSQPQNSRYFANYAGVITFLNNCVDGIDFTLPEEQITDRMSELITEAKRDVKCQLDLMRRKGAKNAGEGSDDTERIQMISDISDRFEALLGCESQIAYMQSIIDMIKDRSLYDQRGLTIPKGALLLGPPGVGKTFIARAMAGELQAQLEAQFQDQANSPENEAALDREEETRPRPGKRVGFMSLSAPEITTRPVSFIGSIFDKTEEYDVCVIFIDEVDAIAKNRFQNPFYSHFIELIKQMDGVEQRSNVFILAATNAPESLDPAFVRSGRIDKKLEFTLPGKDTRRKMAERGIQKRCVAMENYMGSDADQRDMQTLAGAVAELTPGNTAGDIENIINEGFILYYREYAQRKAAQNEAQAHEKPPGRDVPEFSGREWGSLYRSIYEMVERINIGELRPVGKEEFRVEENDGRRSATSVHEVGHALVRILSGCAPFEKITSLPRGDALGYVVPKKETLWTKKDYENRIRFAMGGRAAEEVVYGPDNISAGASSDIRQATHFARLMAESFGFTEESGFMSIRQSAARYLGGTGYNCSESFRAHSDREINRLLKQLYRETREILSDKKDLIIALAQEVFLQETMTGKEFEELYDRLKDQ